ncbi:MULTISPECIES: hypothetical protein [unclassified Corallococcus]|uniref:hypothetical protein n=1 Tax=unclassified Corallococcus TaxID=2685029 RepID=UPI001A8F9101|nr:MULTISPECIES: hypothetical protein [unclassified Corallococcus]MBN9682159.1 hypothetical protein [Corallococcus sp. NCSPR001]WAS86281.1 hypothetical protein O0N60_04745 [Corallococcus sp. NCRR]
MHPTFILVALAGLLTACGPRWDAVGVRAASAIRDADDHVTVTAVLTCVPANGSEPDGCDKDGESLCIGLVGYPTPEVLPEERSSLGVWRVSECLQPKHWEGTTVVLRSPEPVPRDVPWTLELGRTLIGGEGPRVFLASP